MAKITYTEAWNYADGPLADNARWTSDNGTPFIIASHIMHVNYNDNTAFEDWRPPVSLSFNNPWSIEMDISRPVGNIDNYDMTWGVGATAGPNSYGEMTVLSGAGKTYKTGLTTLLGVTTNFTSTVLADGSHTLKMKWDGVHLKVYADSLLFGSIVPGDMSTLTDDNFHFESDDAGVGVTYPEFRFTTIIVEALPMIITTPLFKILDHVTHNYTGAKVPLAFATISSTETLLLADTNYAPTKVKKWVAGVVSDQCTVAASTAINAIASHTLGLIVGDAGVGIAMLVNSSTGAVLGSGQAFWALPTDVDDQGGGFSYDVSTDTIFEVMCNSTADTARTYLTPSLTINGGAVTPVISDTLWGQDQVGGAALQISGGTNIVVDAGATDGTLRIYDSAIDQLRLSVLPLLTGKPIYGVAVNAAGEIFVSTIPPNNSTDVNGYGFRPGYSVQRYPANTIAHGGSITGTVTFAGAGTITSDQAAMTHTGIAKVTGGILRLTKGTNAYDASTGGYAVGPNGTLVVSGFTTGTITLKDWQTNATIGAIPILSGTTLTLGASSPSAVGAGVAIGFFN